MNCKLIVALMCLLALLSISVVSADENVTDSIQISDDALSLEDGVADAVGEDVSDDDSDGNALLQDEEGNATPPKAKSLISTSKATGYEKFPTKLTFKLTADKAKLANKEIYIKVNKVLYNKKTDKNGQVTLNVKINKKGNYNVYFLYKGDENTTAYSGTSKLVIKQSTKTYLRVVDKYINYRQGLKNSFILKLIDANGKAIKNQYVTFKAGSKSYKIKTDKDGYAEVHLNLKKGNYKVKYAFAGNAPYLGTWGSYNIKVKDPIDKGNGYWVWSAHMYSVDLKKLSKLGTKHILLHSYSIYSYGKSAVTDWIAKAHKYGIKVHIWMQVCYDGSWVRPCNKDNTIKYGFLNSKIKEAKKYAKMKGVDGVHFDYVRFGGTAHLYTTSTDAINYFVRSACVQIHKIKPNCIVSAAVMPEPSMMKYWYGQDISTMGKYLDAIIPMVYKGNFNKDTPWITKIVKHYKKQSKSAVIWGGLQSYQSDNNVKRLSHAELLKDARAAKAGGATGSILFRIGISNYLNFKKV